MLNPSDLLAVNPQEIEPQKPFALGEDHYLVLTFLPDDLDPFEHCDCYGQIAWHSGSQRPADMDGSAEVIDRSVGRKLWWQPYREGKKVYNSPEDRRIVLDLLEYGLQYVELRLHGPARTAWTTLSVEIASAGIGGVEPFPKGDFIQEIIGDLLFELKRSLEAFQCATP